MDFFFFFFFSLGGSEIAPPITEEIPQILHEFIQHKHSSCSN